MSLEDLTNDLLKEFDPLKELETAEDQIYKFITARKLASFQNLITFTLLNHNIFLEVDHGDVMRNHSL